VPFSVAARVLNYACTFKFVGDLPCGIGCSVDVVSEIYIYTFPHRGPAVM